MMLVDYEVALLSATARRHLLVMPISASCAVSAATDELINPLSPPELASVDEAATRDLTDVLEGVRSRLVAAIEVADDGATALRLGRAARELTAALDAIEDRGW